MYECFHLHIATALFLTIGRNAATIIKGCNDKDPGTIAGLSCSLCENGAFVFKFQTVREHF